MKTVHDFKNRALSVFGFTATYNRTATKHWSITKLQQAFGDELCPELQNCLSEAIQHFSAVNGALPERIIIYREEIPTIQYKSLAAVEIQMLKAVADQIKAELVYITARSHQTSLEIYAQGFFQDSFKNAIPGTILDQHVTSSSDVVNEFYMLTNTAKFGIASPTRCTIFHSDIADSTEKLQMLTYKLCHTYFNKTSAVRVPSPILYAQKLAK